MQYILYQAKDFEPESDLIKYAYSGRKDGSRVAQGAGETEATWFAGDYWKGSGPSEPLCSSSDKEKDMDSGAVQVASPIKLWEEGVKLSGNDDSFISFNRMIPWEEEKKRGLISLSTGFLSKQVNAVSRKRMPSLVEALTR